MYGSLLGLVISGTSGCLLFTDTINVPPTISISGPAEVRRGQENMFKVSVANEGQGQTTLEWRTGISCPLTVEQAETSGDIAGRDESTMVRIMGSEPGACVWVVARDRQGARALDTHRVTVQDPQLVLEAPTGLVSGKSAEFTARFPAEPELSAQFYWAEARDCTAARNEVERSKATPREPRTGSDRYLVPRIPRQAFCMVVLARDKFDVATVAELAVAMPLNGDPFIRQVTPAVATVNGTTPPVASPSLRLFTNVQLAAGAENDFLPNEAVTFTWKITAPGGADLPATYCPRVAPAQSQLCFQTAMAGTYRVELSILDAGVSRAAPPWEVTVEDHPPCISATSPSFKDASKVLAFEHMERNFTVLEVQDDGDPLPPPARASERAFYWYVRKPGQDKFEWQVNETSPRFIIPPRRYQALQQVQVRLEYRDRVAVADPAARSLAHCKPEDGQCQVANSAKDCFQSVTWTVDYQ